MDYSGVQASRAPGNQDYALLKTIYKHVDDYDSFEFVELPTENEQEPAAAAEEEPAAGEETTAVEEPAAVEKPAAVKEPAAVEEPAAAEEPAAVEEPATVEETTAVGCSNYAKRKDCKKDDRCAWDGSNKKCSGQDSLSPPPDETEPDYEEPAAVEEPAAAEEPAAVEEPATVEETTAVGCSNYAKRKDCKKDDRCAWDGSNKKCSGQDSLSPPPDETEPDYNQAETFDCAGAGKDDCKREKSICKWKKNECIDKNRRLDLSDEIYQPGHYGISERAVLVDHDSVSVTFEVSDGNSATRYYVALSHHIQERKERTRGLRGLP